MLPAVSCQAAACVACVSAWVPATRSRTAASCAQLRACACVGPVLHLLAILTWVLPGVGWWSPRERVQHVCDGRGIPQVHVDT